MKFETLILKNFIHQTAAMEAKMVTDRLVWGSRNEQVGCGWAGSFLHCAQKTLLMEMAKGIPFSRAVFGWVLDELGVGGFGCVTTGKGQNGWCPSRCTLEIPGAGEAEGAPIVCCSAEAAASLSQAVTDLTVISKHPQEWTLLILKSTHSLWR